MANRIDPELIRPLVGYAMFHLRDGKSVAEVEEMLAGHKIYGQLTASQRRKALAEAVSNTVVTSVLKAKHPGPPQPGEPPNLALYLAWQASLKGIKLGDLWKK